MANPKFKPNLLTLGLLLFIGGLIVNVIFMAIGIGGLLRELSRLGIIVGLLVMAAGVVGWLIGLMRGRSRG